MKATYNGTFVTGNTQLYERTFIKRSLNLQEYQSPPALRIEPGVHFSIINYCVRPQPADN